MDRADCRRDRRNSRLNSRHSWRGTAAPYMGGHGRIDRGQVDVPGARSAQKRPAVLCARFDRSLKIEAYSRGHARPLQTAAQRHSALYFSRRHGHGNDVLRAGGQPRKAVRAVQEKRRRQPAQFSLSDASRLPARPARRTARLPENRIAARWPELDRRPSQRSAHARQSLSAGAGGRRSALVDCGHISQRRGN